MHVHFYIAFNKNTLTKWLCLLIKRCEMFLLLSFSKCFMEFICLYTFFVIFWVFPTVSGRYKRWRCVKSSSSQKKNRDFGTYSHIKNTLFVSNTHEKKARKKTCRSHFVSWLLFPLLVPFIRSFIFFSIWFWILTHSVWIPSSLKYALWQPLWCDSVCISTASDFIV